MSIAVAKSRRPLVLATIMLATFIVAIETTIVATAMPRIVGQLGGFTYYSWVFSAFLLAQSTTTPIYGKLSDMFGRKPVLVGGILLFLAGSLVCGFAWSMTSPHHLPRAAGARRRSNIPGVDDRRRRSLLA
ncbi:MAG: MFS transporter [Aliidongia sp.]